MLNIEKTVVQSFPALANQPDIIRKPTLSLLRKMTGEQHFNHFLSTHDPESAFDFIDQIFDYFNFNYTIDHQSLKNLPATGPAIVFANHPTGSLDGLSLLKIIQDIRTDIQIVADNMLLTFNALEPLLIPRGDQAREKITDALNRGELVILFPADRVSQAGPSGIKDRRWRTDFLALAREANAPLVPVLLDGKNSSLFYFLNAFCRPLAQLLQSRELLKSNNRCISVTIGNIIPVNRIHSHKLDDRHLANRLRQFIYRLKHHKKDFIIEKPLARPENPDTVEKELQKATLLGETYDKHQIFLANHRKKSALIREIGRLRELTFRKVGEGTGSSRDLDQYDKHYRHLVLWHPHKQQIVGSYRIGEGNELILEHGAEGLYTASLYQFSDEALPYLRQSLELGRSFVQPDYWGKASLDYLWQGIGAVLRHNPHIRYLIGPVSVSADYPRKLIDELVFYFQHYYQRSQTLAIAQQPYDISEENREEFKKTYYGLDSDQGMTQLQHSFRGQDCKIPVLFKQYTSLFEEGGIQLLSFNIDPDFGNCIDGLLLADLTKLKAKKRERYIGNNH